MAAEVRTGIALHQWPREPFIRKMIGVPEGFDLCEFDFSGQEMRWMAEYSNDDAMLNIFNSAPPYDDAHAFMGARLTNQTFEELLNSYNTQEETASYKAAKNDRYLGKFANLSLQYRTSAKTLMSKARIDYGIPMLLIEANMVKRTYESTFPGVPRYWDSQIAFAKANGYVESFAGKRFRFKPDAWIKKNSWGSGSTAINFPVQGVGASQKALAMKYLIPFLHRINGQFYFDLHDGLFTLIPTAISYEASREIKEMLSNLPYFKEWGYQPRIPFPVDASIGKNWGSIKEIKF